MGVASNSMLVAKLLNGLSVERDVGVEAKRWAEVIEKAGIKAQ